MCVSHTYAPLSCGPLRATSAELLGSLGPALRDPSQATALGAVFNLLYNNLTSPDQLVSGAAARAMRRLCQHCGSELGEPVLALYDQVRGAGFWG